jgi:hypothetical protein
LPLHAHNLYFVDANGRVGSSCSESVGSVLAEVETVNGWLFHQWLLASRAAAFSTFRAKGPVATWRSSTGHLRRIDYVCGDMQSLGRHFDTWVDYEIDVATVREDHYPAVLEMVWQPVAHCELAQWHTPLMDRAALKAGEAARVFQDTISQLAVPDVATPVDAFHAYVLRTCQVQGSLCFPIPESIPRKEWLSASSWQCMQLLAAWRKQRVGMVRWRNHALLVVLFGGWHSACQVIVRLEDPCGAVHEMKVVVDRQLALVYAAVDRTYRWKAKRVQMDRKKRLLHIQSRRQLTLRP